MTPTEYSSLHPLIVFSRDHTSTLFAIMANKNHCHWSFFGIGYCVRKMIINRKSLEDKEKSRGISETKELVRRNLNFVLYVAHLSTDFFEDSVWYATCLPQTLPR